MKDYIVELDPYPRMSFEAVFTARTQESLVSTVIDLFHRARQGGQRFRFRNHHDYSSNNLTSAPTSTDQQCIEISGTEFQMVKWYGTQGDTTQSHRVIVKPVDGTAVVSINDVTTASGFTVDYTTGIITFGSDQTGNTIKAGFYYDLPVYFASPIDDLIYGGYKVMGCTVLLREDVDL